MPMQELLGSTFDGAYRFFIAVVGGLVIVSTTACRRSTAQPAMPSAEVPTVVTQPATKHIVQEFRQFTGRTAAANSVEVRARVSGYLLQSPRAVNHAQQNNSPNGADAEDLNVTVREGDLITRGTLLFQIDPAPYELALAQAEGSLTAARAQLERFQLDLARAQELLDTRSISQADYDLAIANVSETSGQIANLTASVDRAKLDLSFTKVESPIDGFLGRSQFTVGNLVQADQTVLTTVVANRPIFVYFNVDERSLLDYRRRIQTGSVKSARETKIPIQMGLITEEGYPHSGVIDFVDNTTDPNTGNTQLRGRFENEDGLLSPGLFARISSPFTSEYEAVMVPTKSISMDQQGHYVLIVHENTVQRQSIELGAEHGEQTVIETGLRGGEAVITTGLQRLRNGMPVKLSSEQTTASESTPTSEDSSAKNAS